MESNKKITTQFSIITQSDKKTITRNDSKQRIKREKRKKSCDMQEGKSVAAEKIFNTQDIKQSGRFFLIHTNYIMYQVKFIISDSCYLSINYII